MRVLVRRWTAAMTRRGRLAIGAGALVAGAALAPAAGAATGTAPDGIGERKGYKLEAQRLSDRLELKVNASNGNLVIKGTDLKIDGTGVDVRVERFYNSLSTRDDAMGAGWVLGAGHDVRLAVTASAVTFHGPSGFQTRFDRQPDGSFSAAPDPGIDAKLTRNGDGTFELEWNSKQKYRFDAAGRWTEERDKNDNVVRFAYNAAGHVSTITDTRNRTVTFGYTGGRLTTVRDNAGGRTYTYTYDGAGRLASSALTAYALARDNLNLGVRTLYGYDSSGRLNRVTDPRGNATTIAYEGSSRKVRSITRVTDATTGSGPTTTFTYQTALERCSGKQNATHETKVDGPRTEVADITTHCLDRHDRPVAVFNAKGHEGETSYASNSNVAQLNESGVSTGPSLGFEWTDNDQLSSVTLPTGGQSSFEYEDDGNQHFPTSVRDYAAQGENTQPTWAYDYDDDGNLIEARNAGENVTYRYCYNGNGSVDRVAPPALDGLPLDENSSASACAGHPQGNDTLFTYNARGELTRVDPPGSRGTVSVTYDTLSRVASRTDGRGVRMRFTYDALDRIARIDWSSPTFSGPLVPIQDGVLIPPDDDDAKHVWINYSYDTNGNLTARSDSNGNGTFSYDALNRMTREAPEAPSAVTTYTYDLAGNPTSIEASDEPAPVHYRFDRTNLVESIVDQEGRTTSFTYNDKNLRRKTTYPNGISMEARYDDSKRMTCIYGYRGSPPATDPGDDESCPAPSDSLLTFYRYTYSSLGSDTNRREQVTERDGSVTAYEYDAISRLTKATTRNSAGTITREHAYTYDGESNPIREQVSGSNAVNETRTQAYDLDGALCWAASGQPAANCAAVPAGATRYGYAADGGLRTTSTGLDLTYSLRGHTVEITPPGGAALAMKYTDATQDRRIEAGDQRMAYNQLGLSSQGQTNSSSNATWFVRDPRGTLVGMLSAAADTPDLYYLFDGLGSVVATTDGAGNVVKRYAYEPYGEEINRTRGDRNPWRFASGYFDEATGMLKFGTRYYMPDVARWTQRDPVVGKPNDPTQLNAYGYVGADPVNVVDPSGRFGFDLDNLDWSGIGGAAVQGALSGGVMGLITGGPGGAVTGALSGAASGAFLEAAKQAGDEDVDKLLAAYELYSDLKTLRTIYRYRNVINNF